MKAKTLGFFIILGSLTTSLSAQEYHPFPTHDAVWREHVTMVFGSSNHLTQEYQNFINGDTLYLGNTYHKIYKTGSDNGYNITDGDFTNTYVDEYVMSIREDSSKRIYLLGDPEVLLYDFNLEIGDTLPQIFVDTVPAMWGTYNVNNFTYSVSDIDSVLVADVYHKRFKLVFDNNQGVAYLIEGIGATTGLKSWFYGSYLNGYSSELVCFKQDNLDAYPNGTSCELVVVGINEISSENQIRIFPNPSSGVINFDNIPNEPLEMKIYNITGGIIYETKEIQQKQSVDLSFLSKGMYLIELIRKDEPPVIEKLILE